MKRQVQIFMNVEDEKDFSDLLKHKFQQITFVDGDVWSSSKPPEKSSIHLCASRTVYLWDKAVIPVLPTTFRPDQQYEGPTSGVVIQFSRSILKDSLLFSGRIASGIDEKNMLFEATIKFVNETWRLLKLFAKGKVAAVNPSTGEIINARVPGYIVGPHAASWCDIEKGRLLKDRSTQNFFLPLK